MRHVRVLRESGRKANRACICLGWTIPVRLSRTSQPARFHRQLQVPGIHVGTLGLLLPARLLSLRWIRAVETGGGDDGRAIGDRFGLWDLSVLLGLRPVI